MATENGIVNGYMKCQLCKKNDRQAVNQVVRKKINELLKINNPEIADIFADLPECFLDESAVISYTNFPEKNVLIDPIRGVGLCLTPFTESKVKHTMLLCILRLIEKGHRILAEFSTVLVSENKEILHYMIIVANLPMLV